MNMQTIIKQPSDMRRTYPIQDIDIADFTYLLELRAAHWEYPGKPCPEFHHAILKSGKHSNGFLNCPMILCYPRIARRLGFQMANRFRKVYDGPVDWVVGPAYAADPLVYPVAEALEAQAWPAEKDKRINPNDPNSLIEFFSWKRFNADGDDVFLFINELMTTPEGSTYEPFEAVRIGQNRDVKFAPFTPVLAHRSTSYELPNGNKIIPIFHFDIANFDPEACPYCAAGSKAIKPKQPASNWELLMSEMATTKR